MNPISKKTACESFAQERKHVLTELKGVSHDYLHSKPRPEIANRLLKASVIVAGWSKNTKKNNLIGVRFPEKCALVSAVMKDMAGLIGGDAKVSHAYVVAMTDQITKKLNKITSKDIGKEGQALDSKVGSNWDLLSYIAGSMATEAEHK